VAYKYLYNGKEIQDEVLGNVNLDWYDYGARMYDPALGRFHTQDRFAEKYLDFSPYQYAANNPIMFIDVNGDSLWIQHQGERIFYEDGKLYNEDMTAYSGKALKTKKDGTTKLKGYVGRTKGALDKIRGGSAGSSLISQIQSSDKNVTISSGSNSYAPENQNWADAQNGTGADGVVNWSASDGHGGPNTSGSTSRPSYIGLAHELAHGLDGANGTIDGGYWFSIKTPTGSETVYNMEKGATHWENRIRAENGIPLRTHYQPGNNNSRILINGTQSQHFGNYNYFNNIYRPNYSRLLRGF
jgi:RHS repeat-associated protein